MHLSRSTVVRGAVGVAGLTALGVALKLDDPEPPGGYLAGGQTPDVSLGGPPGSVVRSASFPLDGAPQGRAAAGGWTRTAPLTAEAFTMAALTWPDGATGPARVRTRRGGRWSQWRSLRPLTDLPDPHSGEGNGTRGTELIWVARSDAVQLETLGVRPRGLQLQLIDSGVLPSDGTAALPALEPDLALEEGASTSSRILARPSGGRPLIGYGPLEPPMLGRGRWGADESLRNGSPAYGPRLQQVHIHHTASGNTYAPADVPAQIRGFYHYHTSSLGWSDIGYNFLVDRFGRIWVGRAGGVRRIVMGAHTLGFNSTSTGVAVMGNFETAWPSARVLQSVARLAAWKLNPWPESQPSRWDWVYSQGSDRYGAGRWVNLPVIDGHRDTNETACPGRNLYARLPWIRTRAQALTNAW